MVAQQGESRELSGLNHHRERYRSFVAALQRMRWFVLVSVTVSSMMLLHVTLEQYSFQDAQLQSYYTVEKDRAAEIDSLRAELDRLEALGEKDTKSYQTSLEKWAELQFLSNRTKNTLNDLALRDQRIPILGMVVPSNDLLLAMSVFVFILVVAIWLNVRSIDACVEEIRHWGAFEDLKDLLRLNFTFTGLIDRQVVDGAESDTTSSNKRNPVRAARGDNVAKAVQYLALLWPAIATLFAVGIEVKGLVGPLLGRVPGVVGPVEALLLREAFLFIALIAMVPFTLSTVKRTRQLDSKIKG